MRMDADLAEQAVHAEGARLVGHDGHDARADGRILEQLRQHAHEGHRRRELAAVAGLELGREGVERGHRQRLDAGAAARQVAARARDAGLEISGQRAARLQAQVGDLGQAFVGHRQREAVAQRAHRVVIHLLLLVVGVGGLAGGAHAEALDGLGQDHGGLAAVLHRGRVGGVDLDRVVAAARQRADLGVAQVRDAFAQHRVGAEEVLAHVGAVARLEHLVFAVDGLHHAAAQAAVVVVAQQRVPAAAPDDLDDVPARAAVDALQLLDDLGVAAHRPVEPLQVAVDDEDQVVQLLASGHRDGGERLGLVLLAVAQEGPHLAALRGHERAVFEIARVARLVGRHQRPQAHRHRRELPEVGHRARVRIGRQPAARLLAKQIHARLVQPAFEEGARVDARRRVALDEDHVAAERVGRRAEEMAEAHFVERGRRRIRRDVAADARMLAGAQHERHRVPAQVGVQRQLLGDVAREGGLLVDADRVDVGRGQRGCVAAVRGLVLFEQLVDQEVRAAAAFVFEHAGHGVQPLLRLLRVHVDMVGNSVHRACS